MSSLRLVVIAIVGLTAACSSGDDGTESDTDVGADATVEPTTAAEVDTTVPTAPPVATTEPSDDAPTEPTVSPSTTEPAPTSELADALGFAPIDILTPSSGGGDRPDLAWVPVDGADTYQVTLLTPDGAFYWGWTGTETSVPVGGFPRLLPESSGPRVLPDMTWTVTAYDADTKPLALGGPASISP